MTSYIFFSRLRWYTERQKNRISTQINWTQLHSTLVVCMKIYPFELVTILNVWKCNWSKNIRKRQTISQKRIWNRIDVMFKRIMECHFIFVIRCSVYNRTLITIVTARLMSTVCFIAIVLCTITLIREHRWLQSPSIFFFCCWMTSFTLLKRLCGI